MAFTSFAFLGFFIGVLAVYWSLPRHRLRMGWLLAASAGYYMTWNPWLIALILFSASVDFAAALALERSASPWRRWLLVAGSVALNLGLLAYYKYANFFLDSAGWGLSLFGVTWSRGTVDVVLPLGISFYTFETVSYIVDVYARRTRAVGNPLDYALFILFFPHLMAGPIVRAGHFLPQVERPKRLTGDRAWLGIVLIVRGLVKKVVLADNLALYVVDPVFANAAGYGSGAVWLAAIAYALQVYGDFAGYSDMAIGMAHLFDFRLPANFNNPYLAASPAEFWRRWHISLSTWLRDYLFVPLGGSRWGALATCRNLFLVMALGGLWHGATAMCVLWGVYHGVLLVGQRLVRWPKWLARPEARPLCIAATFALLCIGLVIFRAQSLGDVGVLLAKLLVPTAGVGLAPALGGIVLALLALVWACGWLDETGRVARWERTLPVPILGGAVGVVLALALVLWPADARLFLYFQF
jgi:alginate O-acetyltransferase complex protein AlgI